MNRIKPKIGACKKCGFRGPLIAGLCQRHYWLSRRKPTGEKALFEQIWAERRPFSYLTGLPLTQHYHSAKRVNMFAHILAKGKYPRYRLKKENIVLLTPYEHWLFDQGTEEQREKYAQKIRSQGHECSWDQLFDLKQQMKRKY